MKRIREPHGQIVPIKRNRLAGGEHHLVVVAGIGGAEVADLAVGRVDVLIGGERVVRLAVEIGAAGGDERHRQLEGRVVDRLAADRAAELARAGAAEVELKTVVKAAKPKAAAKPPSGN